MLLSDCSQHQSGVSVIAVIGIWGLGKTTLAQLVYNDDRIQKGFELCMWACINYFSSLQQILMTLLKYAICPDIDELQSSFRKKIEGKRFLLVLDDVWDEDPQNWRPLKQLLSSGMDGSKVLITTRSKIVAQRSCAAKPYFDLKGLSDESALLLFKKVAFDEVGDRYFSEFEELGRQIVRKCANVPLAIVIIASLLSGKEKEHWFPLVNYELSKVIPGEYMKIIHILEFSYKELPYPVKRCFGYCSLFPKDCLFDKETLVGLWIAQGFVEPLVNQSLEDRAEDYLFYLVNRCFFQISTYDSVAFKMHDLMHDLATTVAGFESVLVDQSEHGFWDNKIHHLSITSKSMVDRVCSFSHLKSLRTFYRPNNISLEKISLKKLISSFRSIRVLDLCSLGIEKLPTSIGELIHLRFLDLSWNDMEGLPGSICSLCHLQFLDLRGCKALKELPENLGNLLSLRHLLLEVCGQLVKMPAGLAALTSLVTLDKIIVHNPSGGLRYLEDLDNLTGSLQIVLPATQWENATTDAEGSFLSRKSRLRTLDITHKSKSVNTWMNALQPPPDILDLRISYFCGKEMPQWVSYLRKLVFLKLKGCDKCIALPSLCLLPSLKKLDISDMSSMVAIEDSMFCELDLFFTSLETLLIKKMPNLTSWWLQASTMLHVFPCVTNVKIQNCPKLTRCMPLFPLVEGLELENVPEEIIWSETTYSASHGSNVLKKLEIRQIVDLRSIAEAQLRHLYALQELRVRDCQRLKSVSWNGLAYLTSLERLEITRCEEFNWDGQEQEVGGRIHLPRVRHLEIPTANKNLFKELKDMTSLETLIIKKSFNPELQEEEELPWKHLQKLERMELALGGTFSMRNNQRLLHGIEDLTSLEVLHLLKCEVLCLSWRALLSLPNLQVVTISEVKEVIEVDSDPMMIQTLPINRSIRELKIEGGSGEWVNDIPWKSFPSLKYLNLYGIRNLEALPEGIQHLAALESFFMTYIKDLVSLPHWMSSLSSLDKFSIWDSCEELKKRCQRLKGEDWPKIQHIPNIYV